MISKNQQEFINKISPYFDKAELLLAALVAVALVFKIQHWPGSGIMLTISLQTLAVMYFFTAFSNDNNPQAQRLDVFFTKLMYWGLSFGPMGLLFTIQKWPNGNIFITICSICCAAGILYIFKVKRDRPEATVFSNRLLFRLIVFAIISTAAVINKM